MLPSPSTRHILHVTSISVQPFSASWGLTTQGAMHFTGTTDTMWGGSENQSQKTLGMTSAISLALPKPADLEKSRELENFLRDQEQFEADVELHQR